MKSRSIIIVTFDTEFSIGIGTMFRTGFTTFLCCLIFAVFHASAQEPWTLEQCITYACDNNIQLKQQLLNVTQAENNLLQSKLNLLPDISALGNFSSSKGKVLDQNTFTIIDGKTVNSLSTGISGSVSLFRGLQQKNTIDLNLYSLLADIQNTEKLKNDISINITLFYLQIIHAQEQLAVAKNQLDLTMLQAERTTVLVDAGDLPENDLLEIQSQVTREELQIVTAGNTLELSRLNLAQLLDLESQDDFQIKVPDSSDMDISGLTISVDDVFAIAETVMPQVKVAEYDLKVAEKQLAIAKGYRSPTLSLSGGYNSRYSSSANKIDPTTQEEISYPLWDQLRDGINSYISVGLSIPLFSGWQVQTEIKNAELSRRNSQYQLQLARNGLYKEIQQAHADAHAALKRYHSAAKAVDSTEELFHHSEQRFELGLMNFVEYSTVKMQLTAAQSEMLQAKFEYIFKVNILDFYNGNYIRL